MKKNFGYLVGLLSVVFFMGGCKKDNEGSGLKSVFSYVADGYKVNFTNYSANATEYSWDFGDGSGQTSDKRNPEHIFTKKGDFLVSLTAKKGAETNVFKDTVSIIGPNIKIDGDFTDWQYVTVGYENPPTVVSSIRSIKTFAGSTDIFFYLEGTSAMKMEIVDIYIDKDNNGNTGFKTFLYPAGSGADILAEGSPIGGWGDVFSHVGPGNGFAWNPFATFGDVMRISALKTSGSKNIIEFSIQKSALGSISGFINFAIIESTSGWAEVGKIPESGLPTSTFIAVQL